MEATAQRVNQKDLSGKEGELTLEMAKRDRQETGAGQGRLDGLYLKGERAADRLYVKTSGRGEATYCGLADDVERELHGAKTLVERLKQDGILKRTLDEKGRKYVNEACQTATESFWALALTERLTKDEFESLDGAFRAMNDTVGEKIRKLDLLTGLNGVDVERTNRKMDGYEEILARTDAALPTRMLRKQEQKKGAGQADDVVILNRGFTIATKNEVWEQYYESVLSGK